MNDRIHYEPESKPEVFRRPSRRDPNFVAMEDEFKEVVLTVAEAGEDLARNGNSVTQEDMDILLRQAGEVVRFKRARARK